VHLPRTVRLAVLSLSLTALAACTGNATPATLSAAAGTAVTVAVEPGSRSVAPNAQVAFTAVVTGTVDTAVTWAVREPIGGTIDGAGRYVAPSGGGLFHVVATSVADPAASATASVTVTAPPPPPPPPPPPNVAVTVTPPSGGVDACRSLALSATVTGTANQAVTWSVLEGAAGGAVSATGVYTAPDTGGIYHVVATSVADPTRTATAAVTVTERVLSVEVNPPNITVAPGGTAQFTATVTTTCGAFASAATVGPTGLVTAN
jgi:hypothetical protein